MKKIFLAILILSSLTSCKKWLDVQPQTQISADELFKTEAGFKEASNGLYSKLATTNLFGREMSYGTLSVMAQDYYVDPIGNNGLYYQTTLYNFKSGDFMPRRDSIWKSLYAVVANANNILEHIDAQKGIFTNNNYALIKAEALGLRGFCHFDVLRLFANSYAAGKADGKGVPYATKFANTPPPIYKISEVVTMVIKDLTDAKALLATSDPILSKGYKVGYGKKDTATENADPELFHQYRRTHINYYAVCAELARVYLYTGDYANALSNATEVMNANKFPWTKQADMMNSDNQLRDWIMYKEIIFGIYAPNASGEINGVLNNGSAGLSQTIAGGDNIFEASSAAGGDDLRYKTFLQVQAGGSGSFYRVMKYYRDGTANLYEQIVPAIRLSEMYYIAAEATFDTDPAKACDYYNTVRFNRHIGDVLSTTDKATFLKALTVDARKEFFAEGQMFYLYKRLGMPFISNSGTAIPVTAVNATWPFPDDEISYGNR